MKMVSLKRPCNQIQKISCVPNKPNTMANCIGELVMRRDGDKSVIWMVQIYFYLVNSTISGTVTRKGLTTPLTCRVASICSLCAGTVYIVLLGSPTSLITDTSPMYL